MLNWLKNLPPGIAVKRTNQDLEAELLDATIIPRDLHPISRKYISDNALKVMYRLNKAGFDAHLVGGCLRDLLLGGHPKDFDIATDATPDEVRSLFKNSRIIGRRFQIVHVRFGRDIVEVTTYRGHHNKTAKSKGHNHQSAQNDEGMLLRDNVYGSIKEDACRRDITVNALYYSVKDFAVHDYCGGIHDLRHRVIRIIGDPEQRYREDPVRMLRVIRFAAKLGFEIDQASSTPLLSLGELLLSIPSARLFDEVLKLFMAGHANNTYHLLCDYQLFDKLFPLSDTLRTRDDNVERLFTQAFINTDTRISQDKPVTPAFIFAALLWPVVHQKMRHILESDLPDEYQSTEMAALHAAATDVIQQQVQHTAIPRRFQMSMREIWELQLRLPKHNGKRAQKLVEHPRFRAAYDFLLLREHSGEISAGLGQWWTDYQEQNPKDRPDGQSALHPTRKTHINSTRHRHNKRKPRKHS